jgi:GxxExxY protein
MKLTSMKITYTNTATEIANDLSENPISAIVVDSAYRVHKTLGPGLLESIYEKCMARELQKRGLFVERQTKVEVWYDGELLDAELRLDLRVNQKVIVEVKSVEALNEVHLAQLLTYLRLADNKLGLLINFNVALIKNGIRRVVNDL